MCNQRHSQLNETKTGHQTMQRLNHLMLLVGSDMFPFLHPPSRFEFRDTGLRSETGAAVVEAALVLSPLRGGDGGVYRCRVDFREAPTRNTRIELHLIGE